MAMFEYNALTADQRLMKGTIEAASQSQAAELLSQMNLTVNSIRKQIPKNPKTPIGRNEFLLFNQQLASITKAAIPLERALRELARDVSSRPMKKLINEIAADLESGTPIDKAFDKRKKNFPPLYGNILKAGVETSRLSEMLTSLNRHIELANQTKRIVFEALAYPLVVLALAAVLFTFIFIFIMPQFGSILQSLSDGSRLPDLTRSCLFIAENIIPFWIGVAVIVAALTLLTISLSRFPAGRRFTESILLKIPVFAPLYKSSILSKMAESMSLLIAAGSDMPQTLRLSASAAGSQYITSEADLLAKNIEQGTNIIEAGRFCKLIPRLFLYSIQLGSQRNELQDNLYELGQMYSQQIRSSQARLQTLLLPLMIIFVGVFIALIILSIFLPIIQVVTSLSG